MEEPSRGGVDLLRELAAARAKARCPRWRRICAITIEGSIVVIGIDANDERGSAKSFVKKTGVTFPMAFDPNGTVTTGIFQFATVPETAFVTAKGVVKQIYFGAIPKNSLVQGIAALRRLSRSETSRRPTSGATNAQMASDDPIGVRRGETLTEHAVKAFGHRAGRQRYGDAAE